MDDRLSFGKRMSDAFLPPAITRALYTTIVPVGPAEINGWSFMHLLSGMILALLWPSVEWWQALIIHTMWELFQALIGDNKMTLETLVDVPLDTLFFMAGFLLLKNKME